jgi:hypothetical protein
VPTGFLDEKYRVQPIYTTRVLIDVRNENPPFQRGECLVLSTLSCLRDLMPDLMLQDLDNLTSEELAQILSKEKGEILGEQRVPAEKRAVNRLNLNSLAGSVTKVRKPGGRNVRT